MDKTRITSALQEAAKVTRASQEGENTAGRVGGVMEETLHCIEDAADAITNIENGTTVVPGADVKVTPLLAEGRSIATIRVGNTTETIKAPEPGEGGGDKLYSPLSQINGIGTPSGNNKTLVYNNGQWGFGDNGSGGGNVVVTPVQGETGGTRIAKIKVGDNPENSIYAPSVEVSRGYAPSDASERVTVGSIKIGNGNPIEFYAPKAGSGTLAGIQQTYFTNVLAGTAVNENVPTASDYNENNNTFGGTYSWKTVNENPASDQDTWMLIVWFRDGDLKRANIVADSISVVKIFDSSAQGSNGEDSNEIEWIYLRSDHAITGNELTTLNNYLSSRTGSNTAKDGKTFEDDDAIPNDYTYQSTTHTWEDHPQGIEVDLPYEYAAWRVSTIDSGTKKRKWGVTGFSEMIIWAKWGEKGLDGDGVEYIFAVGELTAFARDENNPTCWDTKYPEAFQHKEYKGPGTVWNDDPIDLSEEDPGTKEWVSKRKYDGETGLWKAFSAPALWAYKAEDGLVEGYIVDLDNENMPVGTDDAGRVWGYKNTCEIQAFHNNEQMTCVAENTALEPGSNNFYYTIGAISRSDSDEPVTSSNFTASKVSPTSPVVRVDMGTEQDPVTGFDKVVAKIPITIYLPGDSAASPVTYKKTISVYGIATGEAGQTIDLYVSASSIQCDYYCQDVFPNYLDLGVRIGKGNNVSLYPSGSSSDTGTAEYRGFTFQYKYYWKEKNGDSKESPQWTPASKVGKEHAIVGIDVSSQVSNKYIVVQMLYNGTLIDAETIHYLRQGAPGIGYSAINYNINVLSNNIIVDPTTNKAEGSISFNITRTEAGVTKVLTNWTDNKNYWLSSESDAQVQPNPSDEAKDIKPVSYNERYNPSIYVNGNIVSNFSLKGKTTFNIAVDATLNAENPFTQVLLYSSTSMPLASVVVPFIFKGDKGDSATQSISGVLVRFRGWSDLYTDNDPAGKNTPIGIGAVAGASGIVYKDIIVYNNEYFYIAPSYTGKLDPKSVKNNGRGTGGSSTPKATNGDVNPIFQYIPMLGDAAFQTLLARVAYIENLTAKEVIIVKDNKPVAGMTSGGSYSTLPSGVTLDDVRIWAGFDAASGNLHNSPFYVTEGGKMKANNADISGKITATDGTIGGFTISDRNLVSNTTINDSAVSITPSSIKIKSVSNSDYYTELTSTGNVSIYRGQTAADNSLIVNGGNSRIYLYGTGDTSSRQQFIVGGEENTEIRGIARFNCDTQFNGPAVFNKGVAPLLIKVPQNTQFVANSYVSYGLTDANGNASIPEGTTILIAFGGPNTYLGAPAGGHVYWAGDYDINTNSGALEMGRRMVELTYVGTLSVNGTNVSKVWIVRYER